MVVAYCSRVHHDVHHLSYGSIPLCPTLARDLLYHMTPIPPAHKNCLEYFALNSLSWPRPQKESVPQANAHFILPFYTYLHLEAGLSPPMNHGSMFPLMCGPLPMPPTHLPCKKMVGVRLM